MFDPWMILFFLVHTSLLIGGCLWILQKREIPRIDRPLVTCVLMGATLILTGHLASLGNALGSLTTYVPLTFVVMAGLLGIVTWIDKAPRQKPLLAPPHLSFVVISQPRQRRFLGWFLLATLGLAALCVIILGFSVYADNADSMIYRLPRAFWYASHGSFLHPFEATDKRLTFYPLNGVALYIPFVLYNLPGTVHNLPSLCAWGLAVFIAFRFARELGADKLTALFAAWLVALTPGILAQAISTNDEILAAVSLLLSLLLGWRWLVTGRSLFFFLALTAAGLSVGTKMHIVYLIPLLSLAAGMGLLQLRRKKGTAARWGRAIGKRAGISALIMTALMILPFFFYNYLSTGRFYFFNDFAPEVFNLHASLQGAFQNLLIYIAQMTLAPVADLNFWPDAAVRQVFNSGINALFDPLIQGLISNDATHYHMSYRFVGITLPVSVRFVEFSLWSGFVWLLWPLQASLALKQKFPLRKIFFLLAITPPTWLVLWSLTTLYMEGTATYFTYFLLIASPAAIFGFAPLRRTASREFRWVLIAFVSLTNLLICFNLVMYSGFRALPDLYYAHKWPYDWDLMDQGVIDEIQSADQIRIIETHEKMPYFAYMHWHPAARYLTPYKPTTPIDWEHTLQLLPISSLALYGFMPIKIPEKPTPGLTYLGTMRGIGREAIFGVGHGLSQRMPEESQYIVARILTLKDPASPTWDITIKDPPAGLNEGDALEFRYEISINHQPPAIRDWSNDPTFSLKLGFNPLESGARITIKVRAAQSHKTLAELTYPITQRGAWLSDEAEY